MVVGIRVMEEGRGKKEGGIGGGGRKKFRCEEAIVLGLHW